MKQLILLISATLISTISYSQQQTCYINPSMEGVSQAHVVPAPWIVCYGTPDTQPGQWGFTQPASDGNTYTSMLHAGNNQFGYREGQTQLLSPPMVANTTYTFTMDLAHSPIYNTASPGNCYSTMALYAGNSQCANAETLWLSGEFFHTNWQEYSVTFTPTGNWTYITFAPYHTGNNCSGYINVMLDNISCIDPNTGMSVTNVGCFGDCNGTAIATMIGGQSPFTYLWSNSETVDSIWSLCADTFYVTITDANNVVLVDTAVITEPPLLVSTISGVTDVTCNGGCDAQGSVSTTGGTSPYSYSWSSGGTDANETGLCSGQYYVTVTDTNGCITVDTVDIIEPPPLIAVMSDSIDVLCNGDNNGSATVSASGGVTGYSYLWSSGGNSASETGLSGGTYTVTVTDNNGCTQVVTVSLIEPPALVLDTSTTTADCGQADGTATVTATGGTSPYTYNWSSGSTNPTANGLAIETYTVTVTDDNGCTQLITANVSGTSGIDITGQSNNANCVAADGDAIAFPTGGTSPFTYAWSNGQTDQNAVNLVTGTYTVTITDINGCTETFAIAVGQNNTLDAKFEANPESGQAPLEVDFENQTSGGNPPYTWDWDFANGNTSGDFEPTETFDAGGVYNVVLTVTDDYGCTDDYQVTIVVDVVSAILIPNVFTPNSDGINDKFNIFTEQITDFHCIIYNRWGTKLYEWFNHPTDAWDGGDHPSGTYYYVFEAKGADDKLYTETGYITMIKDQ